MLSFFEEIVLFVAIPLIALFVSKYYTYEFSTPKFFIYALVGFVLSAYLLFKTLFATFRKSNGSSKDINLYITPVHVLWLSFGFVSFASLLNLAHDNHSYLRWAVDISLYLFVNILGAFYFSNKIKEKKNILWYAFLFVVPGFYIATSSIINFYTGYEPLLGKIGEPLIRGVIRSTIGNVIFVANYLNMLLPIAVYFVLSKDFSLYGKKPVWKAFAVKLISLAMAVLIIIVLSIAQTRSELIALALGLALFTLFYLFFVRKKENTAVDTSVQNVFLRKTMTVMTLLLFVLGALSFVLFNFYPPLIGNQSGTIVARFSGETWSSSRDERTLSWLSTIPIWEKHKLLGQGIGTYKLYDLYGVQEILKKHPEYNYVWNNFKKAHNEYLQQLAETGIVGFLIIVGMLIMLAIYVFKNIRLIEDRDDALLFLSFVVSGVVFAVQCVFSFPGQLLPNALAATFFISVGLGPYFNKTSLQKTLRLKYVVAIILLVLVTLVTGLSAYLRYTHFWSEAYFKSASDSYNNYFAYQNAISQYNSQLQDIQNTEEQFNKLEGQFAYLRPENWHQQKMKETQFGGVPYNQLSAENQRLQIIQNIRQQIEGTKRALENEINKLESQIPDSFYEAERDFLKSIKYDPTFGKSHFYLANMAVDPRRINLLNTQIQIEPSVILQQEYDDYQKNILPEFKHRYFEFLEDKLREIPQLAIYLHIAEAQALVDSIGLFETTNKLFSERNVYKALAQRYADLVMRVRFMHDVMLSSNIKDKLKEEIEKLDKLRNKLIDKYIHWAIATVTLKPGSWMKFPDWRSVDMEVATQGQDIYRALANYGLGIMTSDDKRLVKFLEDLAKIEVTASLSMERKNYWGVPDGAFAYLTALLVKANNKAALKNVLEIYRPAYEYLREKADENKMKKIYDGRVQLLKKDIEKILSGELESSKVSELVNLFENSMKKAFDKFILEDHAKLESDYINTLLINEPVTWGKIYRKSVWRIHFNESIAEFRNKLTSEKISDNAKNSINTMLNYLVDANLDNNNFMFAYERYISFVKAYEFISMIK